MKRTGFLLAALVAVLHALAFPALAAPGTPNRTLSITVINPPAQGYYLDLLIEGKVLGTAGWDESYDSRMVDTLRSLKTDGEFPALTYRHSQLRGDLKGTAENGGLHVFSELTLSDRYWKNDTLGLPSRFRIVIVTEDLRVVTSESVSIKLFQTKMTYDYATGKITKQSTALTMLYIYAALLLPTLAVEIALLLPFGIKPRAAWKRVVAVNMCSMLVLTATIGWTLATIGVGWAQTEYPLIHIWLAIFETVALAKLLGDLGFWRKIAYGLAANTVSAVAVYVLLGKIMGYA